MTPLQLLQKLEEIEASKAKSPATKIVGATLQLSLWEKYLFGSMTKQQRALSRKLRETLAKESERMHIHGIPLFYTTLSYEAACKLLCTLKKQHLSHLVPCSVVSLKGRRHEKTNLHNSLPPLGSDNGQSD